MKSSRGNQSHNSSSDSDDWTLLSPPHSSASSSESTTPEHMSRRSSSNTSLEQIIDDGLTEIDLNKDSTRPLASTSSLHERPAKDGARVSGKRPSPVPGFTALDTTDDEIENQSSSSRRSSLTQSELGEYVDIGQGLELSNVMKATEPKVQELTCNPSTSSPSAPERRIIPDHDDETSGHCSTTLARLSLIRSKLDEISASATRGSSADFPTTASEQLLRIWRRYFVELPVIATVTVIASYLCVLVYIVTSTFITTQRDFGANKIIGARKFGDIGWSADRSLNELNWISDIPSSRQLDELKALQSELSQCIKRQSPASFKYYMSDDRFKPDSDQLDSSRSSSIHKPYRGLVCYGQETQWRKRFDNLKSKYNFDLFGLVQDAKRKVTNDALQSYHPTLQFTLILNQLEYLQFLENKRNKKQTEETIKHLKAENLQLLRRLNQPNETGYQKLVVNLELKNSRLQRENEALKANLMEKAGTVYIKQSMELEQYERENIMLKQFYTQVAQDVSKGLRQFNLHAIDATPSLDDFESLNSQLMLTRGYLRKLGEKISSVLLENESLKEELRETYLSNVLTKVINLPANQNVDNFTGGKSNDSNALITDSCMRNLIDSRKRSKELEQEVLNLRRQCSLCRQTNVDLEKFNREKHLNRTDGTHNGKQWQSPLKFKQLGSSQSTTAINKRYNKDSLAAANEEIVDGLMTFLTKFNHQVESRSLALHEPLSSNVMVVDATSESDLSANRNPTAAVNEIKMIPNYIREEMRMQISEQTGTKSLGSVEADVGSLPINFGADSINYTDNTAAETVVSHEAKLFQPLELKLNLSKPILDEPSMQILRDSWFFKRANQRKHSRNQHGNRNDLNSKYHAHHADWAIKRAKLREKLRKASLYIENHYATSASYMSGNTQKKNSHHHKSHQMYGKEQAKKANQDNRRRRHKTHYKPRDEL